MGSILTWILVLVTILQLVSAQNKRVSRGSVRYSDTLLTTDPVVIPNYPEGYRVADFTGYAVHEPDPDSRGSIPGQAGVDYPVFESVPLTEFSCALQQHPGYYADPDTHCQAFHICQRGGHMDSFLCPNGTIFNQMFLVCDWWYNVNCEHARALAHPVNEAVVRDMEAADERLRQEKLQSTAALHDDDAYSPKSHDLMTSALTYEHGAPFIPQYYATQQALVPYGYDDLPQYGVPRYRRRVAKKSAKSIE